MIEVLSETRCTGCNLCVRVCPTRVFDEGPDDIPIVARQEDCQTCFQCEAYCPADAIFVAPFREPVAPGSEWKDEAGLARAGQLGLYRARVGWGKGPVPELPSDEQFLAVMQSIPRTRT
jgi:NAD-dependent dihydropyrimidine dehydrogenase PreA subunit